MTRIEVINYFLEHQDEIKTGDARGDRRAVLVYDTFISMLWGDESADHLHAQIEKYAAWRSQSVAAPGDAAERGGA